MYVDSLLIYIDVVLIYVDSCWFWSDLRGFSCRFLVDFMWMACLFMLISVDSALIRNALCRFSLTYIDSVLIYVDLSMLILLWFVMIHVVFSVDLCWSCVDLCRFMVILLWFVIIYIDFCWFLSIVCWFMLIHIDSPLNCEE